MQVTIRGSGGVKEKIIDAIRQSVYAAPAWRVFLTMTCFLLSSLLAIKWLFTRTVWLGILGMIAFFLALLSLYHIGGIDQQNR